MLTISSISVSAWPQQTPATKVQPVTATKTSNTVSPENVGVTVAVAALGEVSAAQATYAPSALPPVDPVAEAAKSFMLSNAQAPERSTSTAGSNSVLMGGGVNGAGQVAQAQAQREVDAQNSVDANTRAAQEQAQSIQSGQERAQELQRFKGEFPVEYKSPVQEALEAQLNDLLPNVWKASRAAVDVLIGEEAVSAATERAVAVAEKLAARGKASAEKATEVTDNYVAQTAEGSGKAQPGQVVDTRV